MKGSTMSMMSGVAHGRLANGASVKEFGNGSGKGVVEFTLVLNDSWIDKDSGEKREKTGLVNMQTKAMKVEHCAKLAGRMTTGRTVTAKFAMRPNPYVTGEGKTILNRPKIECDYPEVAYDSREDKLFLMRKAIESGQVESAYAEAELASEDFSF